MKSACHPEPEIADACQACAKKDEQIARQAELIKSKITELRFPPIDQQRAINVGINIFSVHLLAESLGRVLPVLSDQEYFFEITHRGVRLNVAAKLVSVPESNFKPRTSNIPS